MKKTVIFTLFFILGYLFSPLANIIRFEKKYTYSHEEVSQNTNFNNVYAETASLINMVKIKKGIITKNSFSFHTPKNMIVLKIKRLFSSQDAQNVNIILLAGNQSYTSKIDTDGGDERSLQDNFYYTEPIFTDPSKTMSYSISTSLNPKLLPSVTLIGLDTQSYNQNLSFDPNFSENATAQNGINIVSRASW